MRVPKMQHFKPKNLARVRIPGKDGQKIRMVYLGESGSKDAEKQCERVITEFLTRQDQPPSAAPLQYGSVSHTEVIAAFDRGSCPAATAGLWRPDFASPPRLLSYIPVLCLGPKK